MFPRIWYCTLSFVEEFPLRNFLPLCERHFTANDKNQLTANYLPLIMPKRSLILSEGIINFHTLNHEQIRNFCKNSNFLTDHSLKVPNIFEFTYFNLILLLYILYRLLFFYFVSNHFYGKKSPRHFHRWGNLCAQTRKKKKRLRIFGNMRKVSKPHRMIA